MKFFFNKIKIDDQVKITIILKEIVKIVPFFRPKLPKFNKPFKTMITNCGSWGWKSDIQGYAYVKEHPVTKSKWPKIPEIFLKIWRDLCINSKLPNSCLINLYEYPNSNLGLHQDKDENDFTTPVLSISLGSSAIFKYGKDKKNTKEILLRSGSVVLMGGNSRLDYHGISKIIKVENNILNREGFDFFPDNSRVNVTLRRYEEKFN